MSEHDVTLKFRITKRFVQYKYPCDIELAGKSLDEIHIQVTVG